MMRPTRIITLALIVSGTFWLARPLWAQGILPSCQESDEAKRLYDLGIDFLDRNKNDAALELFQRSYELSHCAKALANMSSAEKGLKRWADAVEHLKTALESDDPWIEQHREEFRKELKKIEEL